MAHAYFWIMPMIITYVTDTYKNTDDQISVPEKIPCHCLIQEYRNILVTKILNFSAF